MHLGIGTLGRVVLMLGLMVPECIPVRAQEPGAPAPQQQQTQTFAGNVTALTPNKVTVTRSILGRSAKRTFLIKPDTRIEGKLRVKAKVTVGFATSDEGDVAKLIVVRSPQKK
ncbi:MAG: hypothetical protein ACRD4P_01175 [Bryobacteraceae bacterium]